MSKPGRIPSLKPSFSMAPTLPVQPISHDWRDDRRGSRQERGYGAQWDRLRLKILKRDGYVCRCAECKRSGVIREATEVDHIVSKAQWQIDRGTLTGVDGESNLQAINHDCHVHKTQEDRQKAYAATQDTRGVSSVF